MEALTQNAGFHMQPWTYHMLMIAVLKGLSHFCSFENQKQVIIERVPLYKGLCLYICSWAVEGQGVSPNRAHIPLGAPTWTAAVEPRLTSRLYGNDQLSEEITAGRRCALDLTGPMRNKGPNQLLQRHTAASEVHNVALSQILPPSLWNI